MSAITAVLIGIGDRSLIYANEALRHPESFTIVGAADPNPARLQLAKERFHIPDHHCFSSAEELASVPKFADAAINGTMDRQHVDTTIPLLEAGYDVLLEKPFAMNESEANRLLNAAKRTNRIVMICHVLRYAPFYRKIKEEIVRGSIGLIMNIQMGEQVCYHHAATSYVRGKYADPKICGSGMLLSKCSHDLDLLAWMMAETKPASVSSIGSIFQYRPQQAPEHAGTHCFLNCPIEPSCPYSAKALYLEHPARWTANVWRESGLLHPTETEKRQLLEQPDCPYSQCVYRPDGKIVDHQSVLISCVNDATGIFQMNGGAVRSDRSIRLTGTKGEIEGHFEEERFTLRTIDPAAPNGFWERIIDVSKEQHGNAHGGGDAALVQDFLAVLQGKQPSICCTTLEDSMIGHQLVFRAEESRLQNGAMLPFDR